MSLQEFSFVVSYIPGAYNQSADCLSRLVNMTQEQPSCYDDYEDECSYSMSEVTFGVITEEEWVKQLLQDDCLKQIIELISQKDSILPMKPWKMIK